MNIILCNFEYTDEAISLHGKYNILGRSLVIHEKEDDLGLGGTVESKKTGSAGGRMFCATVGVGKRECF